jgi:hypothetical protein
MYLRYHISLRICTEKSYHSPSAGEKKSSLLRLSDDKTSGCSWQFHSTPAGCRKKYRDRVRLYSLTIKRRYRRSLKFVLIIRSRRQCNNYLNLTDRQRLNFGLFSVVNCLFRKFRHRCFVDKDSCLVIRACDYAVDSFIAVRSSLRNVRGWALCGAVVGDKEPLCNFCVLIVPQSACDVTL